MATCHSCGSSVPEGQELCSMCYGDIKAIIQAEHKAMKHLMELLNVWADTYLSSAHAHASPISHRKD